MKPMTFFKKIVVTICSILLFFSVVSVMFLTATKNMISKESIADYINKSNILEMKVSKYLNLENTNISADFTLRETALTLANEANIPESIVDDLIESNELYKLLGDFIKGIINYAIVNEAKPIISAETIASLISVANNSLENHIDIVMEEEELDSNIQKYVDSINNMVPDRSSIVADSATLDIFKTVLTFNPLYLYGTILVLSVIIGLILFSAYKPLKYLGITTLISGIFYTIIGSLEWPIYNYLKDRVTKIDDLIHPLLEKVLFTCFKEGVIYTVIGVCLIITFVMINRFNKNKIKLEETRRINIEDINIR